MSSQPVKISLRAQRLRSGTLVPQVRLAVGAGSIAILLVILRIGLWSYDLTVPLTYTGDALYETVLVKALLEGGWNYHIVRLGAPFGMDNVDFPAGRLLDFLIIKVLSFAVRNPGLLINLYWLLTLGLAAAFAALLFRWLRVSPIASITFGALYGIIPFVFYRNISHLSLVHFMVPGAAYIGLSLSRGESFLSPRGYLQLGSKNLIVCVGICFAIGLVYIYWAFFACVLIAVGCLIGSFRAKKGNVVLTALLYVVVITLTVIANLAPSLVYWHRHGANSALNYKAPAEADIYGLKVRQMVTPIHEHPVRAFQRIREKLAAAAFPYDENESVSATLGTIGTLGFVVLVGVAILGGWGETRFDARLRTLAGFAIALLLIGGVGGFGSLFNVFVMHEFRCYNRISPIISLFSLGAVAILFDHVVNKLQPYWRYFGAVVILFVGAFDQVTIYFFKYHTAVEQSFREDSKFIAQLEQRVPSGLMIFQLPNTGFPLDGMHERMGPYDNARAYLHSKTLRWSWGAMDGRQGDWAKKTATLPPRQLLEQLAFAGFGGLMIDRAGYADNNVEREIAKSVGERDKFDPATRWVFFDLRNFSDRLLGSLPEPERAKRREMSLYPIAVEWRGKFSTEEHEQGHSWHWCGKDGFVRLVNDSNLERLIEIEAAFQQHSRGAYPLRINCAGTSSQVILASEPVSYHKQFVLKPHSAQDIHFHFVGPVLKVPSDSRDLAFRIVDFRMSEQDGNERANPEHTL